MLSLIRKAFARRAAPADPAIAAMLEAERAVRKLIDARDTASINERLAVAALPRDQRGTVAKIAKGLPKAERAAVFKAIDALGDVQKAGDAILFKEIGYAGHDHSGSDPVSDLERATSAQQAQSLRKSADGHGKPMSHAQAQAAAIRADPSLYKRYRAERRAARGWPV